MNELTAEKQNTTSTDEKDFIDIVDSFYNIRLGEIMEMSEDEASFRSALSDFQTAADELGHQCRAVAAYNDDAEQKIRAQDTLDQLRANLKTVANMGAGFAAVHRQAREKESAVELENMTMKICHLGERISATIHVIKNGKDALLAVQKANAEALIEANETVCRFHRAVDKPRPIRVYPLSLPPLGEKVPELPDSFCDYMDLPPEEMELDENDTLKIPQGYKDAEGNDLTNLFTVDWETGLVTSELKPEETQNGKVKWAAWYREYPGQPRPPLLHEYMQRLAQQFFAPPGSHKG